MTHRENVGSTTRWVSGIAGGALALWGFRRAPLRGLAATPERLYRFWRNSANLPRIMSHIEQVEVLSQTYSRWRVKAPGGRAQGQWWPMPARCASNGSVSRPHG